MGASPKETYEELEVFTNVLAIVQKNYVDEVTTKQLIDGAINGMLTRSTRTAPTCTPDLYKELQVDTQGSFGGLGIEITTRNGVLTVVSPIEDTPAYRAGVKPGDQIIKIDDEFTKDMPLVDAVKKMRGPKGTKVTLTLQARGRARAHRRRRSTREVIKIQSVKSQLLEQGLRLPPHHAVPGAHRRRPRARARSSSTRRPAASQGLVLDLRNNPGGLLTQAVKVSDLFLDSGLIVYTDGRLENQKQKYFAHKAGQLTPTSRWWCWSTAAAPAPRRSSPARCRTTSARSCSARRPSARARCRPSCRSTTTRRSA